MEFTFRRLYRGPVKLVIFDWIGTTIDYGCYAPVTATVETFKHHGIGISPDQVRALLEVNQRERIKALGQLNSVTSQWQKIHERVLTDHDLDEIYTTFQTVLLRHLANYTDLIPETLTTINALSSQSIKIGATTDYFTEAMNLMQQATAAQGYMPDSSVCASQIPSGRPEPWMIFETMKRTGVYPPEAVVNIGDTLLDVEAGLNAGVWTIYIAQTGCAVGHDQSAFDQLDPQTRQSKLDQAYQSMLQTGVHHVVDGIWDIPAAIDEINARLTEGEKPSD